MSRIGSVFTTSVSAGYFAGENPKPVNVVLVPVRRSDGSFGLLSGLRSIEQDAGYGKFGLPAGWQDNGETPVEGAVREVLEEHGLELNPETLKLFDIRPGYNMTSNVIAWLAREHDEADLPPFVPNHEVKERKVVGPGDELAFPVHNHWASEFFKGKRSVEPLEAGRAL